MNVNPPAAYYLLVYFCGGLLLLSGLLTISKTGLFRMLWRGFINALDRIEEDENPKIQSVPAAPHEHQWRQVTEFVRQCNDRKCSAVEFPVNPPDGMREYVGLMTTRQAKENPKLEASIYPSLDPRMIADGSDGVKCEKCARVYPAFFPWCPYCDPRPIDIEIVQRYLSDH